jgi:hypothetical protein
MRHFVAASAVPRLAGGVVESARAALLIALAGVLERTLRRVARAGPRAVPLPAVAHPAEEELVPAVESAADHQPQRIHALPRSGRGGWTATAYYAKKGAATRALPRWVMPPEGPGWRRLRTLTPQRRRRERSTSTHRALATDLGAGPVANSALSGDGQQKTGRPRRGRPRSGTPAARFTSTRTRTAW